MNDLNTWHGLFSQILQELKEIKEILKPTQQRAVCNNASLGRSQNADELLRHQQNIIHPSHAAAMKRYQDDMINQMASNVKRDNK